MIGKGNRPRRRPRRFDDAIPISRVNLKSVGHEFNRLPEKSINKYN
jgi:hypothetical protein